MKKRRILVTGAGGSASIGFCRSLKKTNHYFLIGTDIDSQKILLADVDKKYLVPRADSKDYLRVINQIIRENRVEFLHAQPDVEIKSLVKVRDSLAAKTFLPSLKMVRIAQNKIETQRVLDKNRVPVPKSIVVKERQDIKKAFSLLGKKVWFRAIEGAGGKGSLLINDPKIAFAWIKHWDGFGKFMAARYLPGKNIGWDSVWYKGKLIASHTKERLAYAVAGSSPSGISGTAGSIKSIKRPEVDEIGRKAILSVDSQASGAFGVDLKENNRGRPFVTEINPGRFLTSSLHFFAETGYSLPDLYVRFGMGERVVFKKKPPVGCYMIRSLDALPIIYGEDYLQKIDKGLKSNRFMEVK